METTQPISKKFDSNEIITNIIKTLENLKLRRNKLDKEIEDGIQLKEKIENQLNLYGEQLIKLADDLEQKEELLNIYNNILNKSESAYSKIVQSTQELCKKVKDEEKKFEINNK